MKKLFPNGQHLAAVIKDFERFGDFGNLTAVQQRHRKYEMFDNFLVKVCGSEDAETQRTFLDLRFKKIHKKKLGNAFVPLKQCQSWIGIKKMIDELSENVDTVIYTELSEIQKSSKQRKEMNAVLDKMLFIMSGTTDHEVQEIMIHDRFKIRHPKFNPYSYKRLSQHIAKLETLERFTNSEEQNKQNRYKYPTIEKLAKKLYGYDGNSRGKGRGN